MRRLAYMISSVTLAFFSLPTVAQEQTSPPTAPPAYTSVSGHVICGDTGLPARFAAVQLISEKPQPKQTFDYASVKTDADLAKLQSKSMALMQKGTGLTAVTSLDGSFEMPQVAAGTYYVVAQLKGYLSPFTPEDMFTDKDGAISRTKAQAEKIVVQSAPVRADVRLERGGSISGVIRYDDGSVAAGMRPVLMVLQDEGKWKHAFSFEGMPGASISDDRGHYRIGGLDKGKYAVKTELPTHQLIQAPDGSASLHSSDGDALAVYSGGVLREKENKPIEVGAGEDVDGIDLVFPIDNLHVVSGTVTAKTDGHSLNSGWVNLNDSETTETMRRTKLEEDGRFKFNYVPEGQYKLVTSRAGDIEKNGSPSAMVQMMNPQFLKKYQDATVPIEVKGDLTGLTVQVADQPAATTPDRPPSP